MRGFAIAAAAFLVTVSLGAGAVSGDTLYPVKDADISYHNLGNHGADGLYFHVWAEDYGVWTEDRYLVKFDLSGYAPGTTIASAMIHQCVSEGDEPGHILMYRMTRDWVEGTGTMAVPTYDGATWYSYDGDEVNHLWTNPGAEGDYDNNVVCADTLVTQVRPNHEWYAWDVTDLVQDWIDGTWPNHGLIGIGGPRVSDPFKTTLAGFYAREAAGGDAQYRTYLDITIPEPGTWLLTGTGALLLFGIIRRRRMKN